MTHQLRKSRFGWCLYDWANSAFATVVLAAVLPVYFVSLVPENGAILPFISNHRFSAASIWGYNVSISMLILAVAAPILGALADRNAWHKRLMILFWLLGCLATALLAITTNNYLTTSLLFILGNIAFAGANIFYNAHLPFLAPIDQVDKLSARGFAFGYIGGGILLALDFLLILNFDFFGFPDPGAATRFGFLLTASWWFIFAIPTFIYLPPTTKRLQPGYRFSLRGYFQQFKQLLDYRDLTVFLVAFLCYNDGIQTVITVSAIYAREELQLGQGTIIGCFLMIQFLAMPGALLFARIGEKTGTARAIFFSLIIFVLVCFFAYRMTTPYEFWILGAVIALILGGSQALSRSLFSSMVPKQKSAEFFSFFSISSRFAAIFGPLLFALIADLSGSSRHSILALSIFFIIGGILLLRVNVKRGQAVANSG
ncbi:MFS transporter, UMF1 family [Desulfuromusa kysingii]|uniref:MFS transporter, UMF1 family n=1 Tax=Desulfuromusa kysingii TaxID=37625 RepID=A0A1H3YX04_9BACT|nr:MFS transporter [Desulfuromusa kysingii]SEA15574.1 MFS transporter, UMF1 family [Desulfuromusa kysingii]